MIVLTAIGRFFKKIWDWIKQTAWIQPLLIVGLIFGVIFSIPSIVSAAKKGKEAKNRYQAYYESFQISLEIEKGKEVSKADRFLTGLEKVMLGSETVDTFKSEFPEAKDKFFLSFVAQECEKCKEARGGFEVLEDKLGDKDKVFVAEDGYDFNMITIFADEPTSETDDDSTAFVKFLDRHQNFFSEVGSRAWDTPYCYANQKLNEADLVALETADPDDFLTPTIMLVELNEKSLKLTGSDAGVTEVMFGITGVGDDDYDKAKLLLDCWNHEGDFSTDEKIPE